jgi:hypothetical protein
VKKTFCFLLCITLVFGLTSCKQNINEIHDEAFQEGVQHGIEDTFLRLYNSICFENEPIISYGDVWDTDHFSLTIYDTINDDEAYLTYDLILKDTTVEDCFEREVFFFNIYAYSDTKGLILVRDDFLWDGLLDYEGSNDEYLKGNRVKSRCELLDNSDIQSIVIIIATKGYLYSATYLT